MKTHRCHDGSEISVNVCLVSHFLFRTELRTIMSSDSEDDADYVPTAPQNNGLYAYSWLSKQLTSSFFFSQNRAHLILILTMREQPSGPERVPQN